MPLALEAAAAALPIACILACMLAWRWSAARAGGVGLLLAVFVALLLFGMPVRALAGIAAEGTFLAATILWILWPACWCTPRAACCR